MHRNGALRLRIYTSEMKKTDGKPLFEQIIKKARSNGLEGGTIFRGVAGYSPGNELHTSRILMLSEDLPLIIEIVDSREKIEAFLPWLDSVMVQGLVTVEPVHVALYKYKGKKE
jgi:PII-like signaling protein